MPQPQGNKQKDPKQQLLRQQKKNWSAEVSALISKIIEFKKALNGRGSAKIGVQPSKIQDKLPESVSSNLQQLTGEWQKIVQDAEAIIAAQANYSATRRKKQPKKPKPLEQPIQQPIVEAPEAPASPTETNPLARIGSINYDIEKYGSNSLTRFWSYLTSVFSREEYKKQRLGMLSLSTELFYNFIDLENDILKLSEKNFPATINKFQNMKNTYTALKKMFEYVSKLVAEKAKTEGVADPTVDDTKIDIKSIKMELNKLVQQYQVEKNTYEKKSLYDKIQEKHRELKLLENIERSLSEKPVGEPAKQQSKPSHKAQPVIDLDEEDDGDDTDLMHLNQIKHNINGLQNKKIIQPKDIQEIMHMINEYQKSNNQHEKSIWLSQIKEEYANLIKAVKNKKADIFNDKIVKIAHNALTRFLRKQLVKLLPFDKTAAPRLRVVDIIADAKKTVRRLMDVLEKDLTVSEITILMKELDNKINEVAQLVSILNVLYKEKFSREHHESDKDLDYALRRKVRKDLFNGIL